MPKKKKNSDESKKEDEESGEEEEEKKTVREKLLDEIVSDIGGAKASRLLDVIIDKEDVNEFLIAKKLDSTINEIRNILYKLSDYNLVSFTRKKDDEKGWYTYFWTLDEEKSLRLLGKRVEERLEKKEKQMRDRENKTHYVCEDCKREIIEEDALEQNFTCPECGQIYEAKDSSKEVRKLKREVKKLKREKKQVAEELGKILRKRERKKKRRRERRKDRNKMPVEKIKGIGKKKAKKFKNNRIKTIAGLLRLKPETVADKTGISVKTAKKYQKRAKGM